MNIRYFCSTNAIFAVQMLFFWCAAQKKFGCAVQKLLPPYGTSFAAVQTFAALWRKFCHLMTRVLPALWPSTNRQSAVQNDGSNFFWGGRV